VGGNGERAMGASRKQLEVLGEKSRRQREPGGNQGNRGHVRHICPAVDGRSLARRASPASPALQTGRGGRATDGTCAEQSRHDGRERRAVAGPGARQGKADPLGQSRPRSAASVSLVWGRNGLIDRAPTEPKQLHACSLGCSFNALTVGCVQWCKASSIAGEKRL
jgi:hypothetical protein